MAAKSSQRYIAQSRTKRVDGAKRINGGEHDIKAALDPETAAKLARLRHVTDEMPGIARHPARHGFDYRTPDGELVRDIDTLKRIRSLVIPPAWTAVWISPDPNGHLQAVGRDVRGRKQYRYHPRWRQVRDEAKYHKLLDFARVLPKLRARVDEDLQRPGLPRERVLAAIVRLMELTLFRIGNTEYAKQNKSFGLTTLRDRHVAIEGSRIHIAFHGKSGKHHETDINDRRLARIVKGCRDLPGYELFQYLDDDGERHVVGSSEVNDYLREITGQDITAKDFRTWAGTHLAAEALREFEAFDTDAERKKAVVRAVEKVAKHLGNTPAVCRRCYIHPEILDGYLDGTLLAALAEKSRDYLAEHLDGMSAEEAAVTAFLRFRLGEIAAESRAKATRPRSGTGSDKKSAGSSAGNVGKERVSAVSD
ncbi:MAG TPA: DNA topoisomerase IB [Stellaceae bacterium]|nr:DNA topoisomerase IB [Stellaceae bacterium]